MRHYIFKDRIDRNVLNLGYGGKSRFILVGGKPYSWGRGSVGGTEGVEDTMEYVHKRPKKNLSQFEISNWHDVLFHLHEDFIAPSLWNNYF